MPHDLLAQPPGTELPTDPGAAALAAGDDPADVAARVPTSSAAWAALSDRAFAAGKRIPAARGTVDRAVWNAAWNTPVGRA